MRQKRTFSREFKREAATMVLDQGHPLAHIDPNRRVFYYARVLENPTCRWSTWEANRQGKEVRDGLPLTILERAWSSPIWVKPQ